MIDLEAWADPRRRAVERWIEGWLGPPRTRFDQALLYPLQTPGKRIRPLLCLAAAEALGQDPAGPVLAVAAAIEMVHTYSLVHDDLPAMDDAETRRGRPTVHRTYDDATAILVGDGLLTEAFAVLANVGLPPGVRIEVVSRLARAAGRLGMVAGQAWDVGTNGAVADEATLLDLHRKKTGELLEAAVVIGGVVGRATPEALVALSGYGAAVGLAFQLADDLLDADEDAGADGPPSFVRLLGKDATKARAEALVAEAAGLAKVAVAPNDGVLRAIAEYIVARDR
jgi:geranylgeranyl pyrophosphate synthase